MSYDDGTLHFPFIISCYKIIDLTCDWVGWTEFEKGDNQCIATTMPFFTTLSLLNQKICPFNRLCGQRSWKRVSLNRVGRSSNPTPPWDWFHVLNVYFTLVKFIKISPHFLTLATPLPPTCESKAYACIWRNCWSTVIGAALFLVFMCSIKFFFILSTLMDRKIVQFF